MNLDLKERTISVLSDLNNWPGPLLTLRRDEEFGMMFAGDLAEYNEYRIVLCSTDELPLDWNDYRELIYETFDTAEEVAEAGWILID